MVTLVFNSKVGQQRDDVTITASFVVSDKHNKHNTPIILVGTLWTSLCITINSVSHIPILRTLSYLVSLRT